MEDFIQKLESTLFFFGFQECKKNNYLNFLKLSNHDYLLMKLFNKNETADLVFAKFRTGDTPCDSEPYWEKAIVLSFSPNSDNHQIIRDFLEKYRSENFEQP